MLAAFWAKNSSLHLYSKVPTEQILFPRQFLPSFLEEEYDVHLMQVQMWLSCQSFLYIHHIHNLCFQQILKKENFAINSLKVYYKYVVSLVL